MPSLAIPRQRLAMSRVMPRGEFIQRLNGLLVTPRLVWTPKSADTTTATTDEDTTGRTVTWDATVAARLARQGRGTSQSFASASTQYGTTPDTVDLSFNTAGTTDLPFSIVVLANVTDTAAARVFVSKWLAANREWIFQVDAGDTLTFGVIDQSANVSPVRVSNAAIAQGSFRLFGATYDGSGGATAMNGVTLYQDGGVIASTATNNASYVAMEDLASLVEIGSFNLHSASYMDGSMALVAVTAVALSQAQHAAIASLCRRYFGVPLGLPTTSIDYPTRWGVVSAWGLTESSGTRADSVVASANNLTDVNTVTGGAALAAGLGLSSQFTAVNSEQLTAADTAGLSFGDMDWWVSLWVYMDTVATDHGLYFKGSGTAATTLEFSIRYVNATNRFKLDLGDSTGVGSVALTLSNSGALAATTVYHIFAYHDSVNDVLGGIVNNGTPTTVTTAGKFPNDTNSLTRLGMFNTATTPHDGRMSDVAMGKPAGMAAAGLLTEIPARIYNTATGRPYPWT